MPDSFDPYYTWLGIPPAEQPADHYRLLGLNQFEPNREVISHAADQRMGHVRSFQNGPQASHSQRVLNELSKASGCLLNPRRKAMYDQHLRSASLAAVTESARLPPAALPEPIVPTVQIQTAKPPARRGTGPATKGTKGTRAGLAVAGIAALAVGGLAVSWFLAGDPTPVADGPIVVEPNGASSANAASLPTPTLPSTLPSTIAAGEKTKLPDDPVTPTTTPPTADEKMARPSEFFPGPDSPGTNPLASATPTAPLTPPLPDSEPAVELPVGQPKSLKFRGADRVELTNSNELLDLKQPFTLEMWVRFERGMVANWLLGNLVMGGNHADVPSGVVAGWQMIVQAAPDGRHRIGFSTQDGYASDFTASEDWHHLATTSDGRRISIHVDGRRTAAGDLDRLLANYVPSPIGIHFGGHGFLHANQPPGFSGELRALRVSSVPRYTANFQPPAVFETDSDTLVLWDFPNSTGRQVNDVSGHDHHGVITGATWVELKSSATAMLAGTNPVPASGSPMPAGVLASVTTPAETTESAAPLPVPDAPALATAREQVQSVFEDEFKAAKGAAEQSALAKKLMGLAVESKDDVAGRYATMEAAARLAAAAGELHQALEIIDQWSVEFAVDRGKLVAAAVSATSDVVKTTADRRKFAELCVGLLDGLIEQGHWDSAGEVAQVAITAAARAKDLEWSKIARDYRDEIVAGKKRGSEARRLGEELEAAPDDAAKNGAWGRYLAFVQRNWSRGLPHLAKSDDSELAALATLDLTQPAKPEEQLALGQRWWALAKQVEVFERPAVTLRALHWLKQSELQLKGLAKAEVEKQIKDLEAALPPRHRIVSAKPASLPAVQIPPEFVGIPGRVLVNEMDAGILWNYRAGLRLTNADLLKVLAQAAVPRGKLRVDFVGFVATSESMTLNIVHQGGSAIGTATLFIDDQPVGEVGGMRATTDVHKVPLSPGEHRVRWVLAGDDIGSASLNFTNAATAQRLELYHTAALLTRVRETPRPPRLNVNMNAN